MKKLVMLSLVAAMGIVGCDYPQSSSVITYEVNLNDEATATLIVDGENKLLDCSKETDANSTTECSQDDVAIAADNLSETSEISLTW